MMAPPGQKQNPMRILYMLPVFFMANKIEYTDILVNILRVSYYVVQLATLAVAYFIKQKIESKQDNTKIFMPPVKIPFAPAPENPEDADRPTESTYYKHEMEQVNQLFKQTLIGMGMVSFIHFKMGMKPVLLLQSIMGPMNLMDNPLIKKYIFNTTERVWGESLQGEPVGGEAARPAAARPAVTSGGKVSDETMEDVIDKVWNKELGTADLVALLNKDNVNFQTSKEGWTPLMAMCTRAEVKAAQVEKALKLGADVLLKDNDGDTALHWAAMKGNATAVRVLVKEADVDVKALLAVEDLEKKTALALAKESVEPSADKVLEMLQQATESTASTQDVD